MVAPSSGVGVDLRLPPNFPIGVRRGWQRTTLADDIQLPFRCLRHERLILRDLQVSLINVSCLINVS